MSAVLQQIPLDHLVEHPDNPRRTFDEAALAELRLSAAVVDKVAAALAVAGEDPDPDAGDR